MALVMNCLDEDQVVRVGGEDFYFKARQIKHFWKTNIAHFISTDRKDFGFVGLPDSLEEKESRETPEAKELIEEARRTGVEAYCNRLRAQIYNLQVSLKNDIDKSGLKVDPRVYASKGDIKAMELLAKYQSKNEDPEQDKINKIKDLEKKIAGK